MGNNSSKINCPIFQKQEPLIKDLTEKISVATAVVQQSTFADRLQEELDILLSCPDHDKERFDCKNCHFIAFLRMTTASLPIKEETPALQRHPMEAGMFGFTD